MKVGDLFSIKIFQTGGRPETDGAGKTLGASQKFNFTVGQLVKGRVTGFTQDGKVLIDIQGRTVSAKSQLPLKVGSELWLEVRQTEPEPWLVLSGKKGAVQEFLQQILGDKSSVTKAVQTLQLLSHDDKTQLPLELRGEVEGVLKTFGNLSLGSEADPEKVIKLLAWLNAGQAGTGRGLFSAGLGEQLTKLLETLKQAGGEKTLDKAALLGIEKLAGLVDSLNSVNSQPPAPNQAPFFLLPCLLAAGAGWGECLVSIDADEGQDALSAAPHLSLTFFLEMSRIGDIHLQVTVRGKSLRGDFVVADEAVQAHMEKCLPELTELMEKLGYGPVYLGCRVAEDNLIGRLKEALEQRAQLAPVNILDVTA